METLPHRYRVTIPMRAPTYFHRRQDATRHAYGIPDAQIHERTVYGNGAADAWRELT